MKANLLPSIVGMAIGMFISSCTSAESRQTVSTENREPYRIYDLGSRNVIFNPDYREPARVKRTIVKRIKRTDQSQRVYNPATQQFENSRGIRDPISRRR
jgi:hypothetical protein